MSDTGYETPEFKALYAKAVEKYKSDYICEEHFCPVGELWCDCGAGEDLE